MSKAFNIANEIVKKNKITDNLYICYHNLSYLYADGKFVAQDLKKAIEISKKNHLKFLQILQKETRFRIYKRKRVSIRK